MSAGLALLGITEGIGGINRTLSSKDKLKELESRGVDVPLHQRLLPFLLGPSIGGRLQEGSLNRKLERTDPGMATRQPLGLEGDAAMNATASFFQQQMSRQLGTEAGMINREFGGAGRFVSGQRGRFIGEAQERAGRGFSDFLSRTALERFLQKERLQTQSDIAMAQIEAQGGSSRLGFVGDITRAGANIFAQNPEWLKSLFTRGGPGELPGPSDPFDPTKTTIQLR